MSELRNVSFTLRNVSFELRNVSFAAGAARGELPRPLEREHHGGDHGRLPQVCEAIHTGPAESTLGGWHYLPTLGS
jgi:hypothetical protein